MATDPTHSESKRNRWAREFERRWGRVEDRVERRLENDRILDPENDNVTIGVKSGDFHDWFGVVLEEEVLEPMNSRHVRHGSHYTGRFVRDMYEHGLERAEIELRDVGIEEAFRTPPSEILRRERASPGLHDEYLTEHYMETYHDLNNAVSDTLADSTSRYESMIRGNMTTAIAGTGLTASGLNTSSGAIPTAAVAAIVINNRVEKVGGNRSDLIAQVKSVGTINDAAINRYYEMGIENAGVNVEIQMDEHPAGEFETAGDDRVCPECADLEGNLYPLEAIRGGLDVGYEVPSPPIHINCRCFITPSLVSV